MGLNTMTDCVLLGLLSHTPMTGYDIKKKIDTTLRLFWNAGYGSIYPSLNRLQAQGYIAGSPQSETGREKVVYSLTESGRSVLLEWLDEPGAKDEMRYETLLKVFLGDDAGPKTAQKHILALEEKSKAQLPFLRTAVAQLEENDSESAHLYYRLTALFGVKVYEAYIEWCEQAMKILEEKQK